MPGRGGDGLIPVTRRTAKNYSVLRQLEYEINQSSDTYINASITPLVPAVVVPTTQPDCSRKISITVKCLSADTLLACTLTVLGKDTRGEILSEIVSFAGKVYGTNEEVVHNTNNAFDTITSITEAGAQNTPANWSWRVGETDAIGLLRKISSAGQIYKIKRNNGEDALANYTIDAVYWTIIPNVAWNNSGEFLEIHYVQ